jgi:biofilm protein TabA
MIQPLGGPLPRGSSALATIRARDYLLNVLRIRNSRCLKPRLTYTYFMEYMETWAVVAACGVMLAGCAIVSGTDRRPAVHRLDKAEQCYGLHPAFAKAFAFLRRPDLASLAPGKYVIDGDKVFCLISKVPGKTKSEAQLEAHRKYIDIQFIMAGTDEMGWRPTRDCKEAAIPYDEAKDIMFFKDAPEAWITVPVNSFVIYFPTDAHAPLVSTGELHKAVVKIAVE